MMMRPLLLPTVLPDENLYSLLARTSLVNGYESHRRLRSELFCWTTTQAATLDLSDFNHLNALYRKQVGSPLDTLTCLTTYDYCHLLQWRPSDYSAGADRQHSATSIADSIHYVESSSSGKDPEYFWRYCEQCVADDFQIHRVAYWHRSHQLPSTFVCAKDGNILFEVSLPKGLRDSQFHLPGDALIQERSKRLACPPFGAAANMRIAALGVAILNGPEFVIAPQELLTTLIDAMKLRGLATAHGTIRKARWEAEFADHYYCKGNLAAQQSNAISTRMMRIITGDTLQGNWLERALLIDWLLGSWDATLEQVRWFRVMNPIPTVSNARSGQGSSGIDHEREMHRKICSEIMKGGGSLPRKVISTQANRTYLWLLENDAEWFDAICPAGGARRRQRELF